VKAYATIVDGLAALGVTHAFGLMGEDTAELITDLERRQIRYHPARHENVAVSMADGFAWATGGLGVCLLSRGPGATNGATALATAALQSRRLLVISGEARTGVRDPKARIDQRRLAELLGLRFHVPRTAAAIAEALAAASADALAGQAAWLAVPVDVLHAPVAETAALVVPARVAGPLPEPTPAEVRDTLRRLDSARLPLILGGRGAVAAGARQQLEQLAERSGALLGSTLLAKDLFRGHPHDLGLVGSFASPPARALLEEVDLVLAFGASLSPFTRAGGRLFAGVPRLRFDLEPGGGVHADARVAAERLLAGREGGDRALDAATRERLDAAQRPETADESTDQAIDPRALMVALDCLLPAQRTLVSDGGHCLGFPAMHVHAGEPGDYLLPQGTHAIGMGLGAALGVAAARPERPIVLFIGDGSLAMTLGDLVTVAEGAVPLLIVVLNDQAYGAERHLLDLAGTANHMSRFGDIEFAEVASGLGLRAATIRRASDLDALAATLREPLTEPLLLDGKIVPDLRARWMEELV
jgi:thiamine pyrophosphate-dependent acetolactate synthase large subunit-like protein